MIELLFFAGLFIVVAIAITFLASIFIAYVTQADYVDPLNESEDND